MSNTASTAGTAGAEVGAPAPTWRIAPSVPVAFGVFVAYIAAFHGLTVASGVTFDDRFANAGNTFRCAVVPLAVATLLEVGFTLWAR